MAKKIGARGTAVVFYSPANCSTWEHLCALPLTLDVQTVRFGGRGHSLQHLDQLSGWATMQAGLPVLALFCSSNNNRLFFVVHELAREAPSRKPANMATTSRVAGRVCRRGALPSDVSALLCSKNLCVQCSMPPISTCIIRRQGLILTFRSTTGLILTFRSTTHPTFMFFWRRDTPGLWLRWLAYMGPDPRRYELRLRVAQRLEPLRAVRTPRCG